MNVYDYGRPKYDLLKEAVTEYLDQWDKEPHGFSEHCNPSHKMRAELWLLLKELDNERIPETPERRMVDTLDRKAERDRE
jgi:hypothetical protein